MRQRLLVAQSFLVLAGATFAWATIIKNFIALSSHFGTIFTAGDSSLANPILTPCFYGGLAFIVAFVWAARLVLHSFTERSQRFLSYLLLFGTIFAVVVISLELCQYYRIFGNPLASCAPGINPLRGPCAIGGGVYLLSFVLSRVILRTKSE